jgi:uncharacterized protein
MNRVDRDLKPWYREPWPWLLMAGPATVIVAGFATLYLAVKSEDGLVVDDYYRQGLAINATLAREERARVFGVSATMEISQQRDHVLVELKGPSKNAIRLRLRLVHPTRTGQDQTAILVMQPGGTYAASIRPLAEGSWRILLEDDASNWRIDGMLLPGKDRAELRP